MKLSYLILKKVGEMGESMLDGFFPAKYPEARLWRNLLGLDASYRFSKPSFSAILSRMQSEGFVERRHAKQKARWRITKAGRRHLAEKTPPTEFVPHKDGVPRIVSFDIPEQQRKKRRWIREALLEYGYRPLQKSVWIGFAPLPENFFEDLDLLSLRSCIQVFSIDRKGTIEEIG
jgi:DNA-binding transcriptional regulator PaaX